MPASPRHAGSGARAARSVRSTSQRRSCSPAMGGTCWRSRTSSTSEDRPRHTCFRSWPTRVPCARPRRATVRSGRWPERSPRAGRSRRSRGPGARRRGHRGAGMPSRFRAPRPGARWSAGAGSPPGTAARHGPVEYQRGARGATPAQGLPLASAWSEPGPRAGGVPDRGGRLHRGPAARGLRRGRVAFERAGNRGTAPGVRRRRRGRIRVARRDADRLAARAGQRHRGVRDRDRRRNRRTEREPPRSAVRRARRSRASSRGRQPATSCVAGTRMRAPNWTGRSTSRRARRGMPCASSRRGSPRS